MSLSRIFIYPIVSIVGVFDYFLNFFYTSITRSSLIAPSNAVLTKVVDEKKSVYRSNLYPDLLKVEDPAHNLFKEFINAAEKYPTKKALGIRQKLKITDELQPDGKLIKKYSQSHEYVWKSFQEVVKNINDFSNGLLLLGLKSNDNIVINAETRPEWLIAAMASFRIKVPIVTLYATLGIEALEFGIRQTETKFFVISGEQIQKVEKMIAKIKTVSNIVVICDKFYFDKYESFKEQCIKHNIRVQTFDEILELGNNSDTIDDYERPKQEDLAIIMYTSGSTGNPKGAMITHGNLLISSRTLRGRMAPLNPLTDVYIGYLPLAHVLELCTEIIVLNGGISVGYSSPHTITDASTGIIKGELGDLRVLNPTIMHSVPAVLEKLSKAVKYKIKMKSVFFQSLFEICYIQKLRFLKSGYDVPILDFILFKRISSIVIGKNLRFLMCAGALLSEEVHEFVQICLCPVRQAYGLTETLASGTTQLINQYVTGTVGSVVPCCELRLVNWNEGEYRITDKPYPRGEIYIGGDNIIKGYYNMPEKTKEDFHVIDGIRFFATGDIGEMNIDKGTLRLVDRKKDIVKLSGGEYVSLNKIESVLKLLPFVDNCCVIARSLKSYCICIVCPNQNKLIEILIKTSDMNNNSVLRIEDLNGYKTDQEKIKHLIKLLEANKALVESMIEDVEKLCLSKNVARFEIPKKLQFVSEIWLPDTGLVTDSLKIKRTEIDKFYQNEIRDIYV